MTQHGAAVVRAEYEDETRLAARKAAYAGAESPDAREVLFEAIAEARPRRILDVLRRRFPRVERRDVHGWIVFPNAQAAQAYVDSLVLLAGARVPRIDGQIRVRRRPSIFVAELA